MKTNHNAENVRRHRQSLRDAGLRPVQIWVPDTRNPDFAKECMKQSLLLRKDVAEDDITDWIDKVADTDGWV